MRSSPGPGVRVLILGGTGAGRALADRLADRPEVTVISSLAGRVSEPRRPAGGVRVGGFDGADGLADYLAAHQVDGVVDATHPFAARITGHAARACARTGIPLIVLRPPGWTEGDGDAWHRVPDIATAARTVAGTPPGVVLLTIGRLGLAAFGDDAGHDYVIRSIHPPDGGTPLPPRHTIILARGPFTPDAERALLRDRGVGLVVTKDSGGRATAPKLAAARDLGLPVVMVDRPRLPPGVRTVTTVAGAAAWVTSAAGGTRSGAGHARSGCVDPPG